MQFQGLAGLLAELAACAAAAVPCDADVAPAMRCGAAATPAVRFDAAAALVVPCDASAVLQTQLLGTVAHSGPTNIAKKQCYEPSSNTRQSQHCLISLHISGCWQSMPDWSEQQQGKCKQRACMQHSAHLAARSHLPSTDPAL